MRFVFLRPQRQSRPKAASSASVKRLLDAGSSAGGTGSGASSSGGGAGSGGSGTSGSVGGGSSSRSGGRGRSRSSGGSRGRSGSLFLLAASSEGNGGDQSSQNERFLHFSFPSRDWDNDSGNLSRRSKPLVTEWEGSSPVQLSQIL
jgi:hypothetical protein